MTGLVAILDIGKTHLKLHVLSESGELVKAFELDNQVVPGSMLSGISRKLYPSPMAPPSQWWMAAD